MPNVLFNDVSIESRKNGYKRDDLKVIYDLKLNSNEKKEKGSVISKILKFDENNQCGFAMAKPLPTGCVKESKETSFFKLNLLLEAVSLEDKTGHLFVVNIEFNKAQAGDQQVTFNEIFLPIIEKDLVLETNERSWFQFLELYKE